jgi:hypothetical protein
MAEISPEPTSAEAPIAKKLDVKTAEVLAMAVFRTLFRDGIHLPIQVEGAVDMDLVIKDNNILLNLNQVQLNPPELLIWRLTFAYQGKPVIDYGRGIKDDMKIHFPQLCFLMFALWRERRKKYRARALGEKARARALLRMAGAAGIPGTTEETAV